MRLLISIVAVSALVVCSGTAWAARCAGWPETSIVFCDDFDQYCTANNPTNPWPGYPPTPDTKCATDATRDFAFFRQPYHWPSVCGTGYTAMGLSTDSWGADSTPFFAIYYGGGVTAQYHQWNLAPTVGAKNPGYNAVNGTDENPLYLRFFFGDNLAGSPPNSPLYLELVLDDDRAPTDYVLKDCMDYNDCNCLSLNPDVTCDAGTCQNIACEGACDFHQCVDGLCADGPKAGQACGRDSQCSSCVGGPRPGNACVSNYDCSGCASGPNQGLKCNSDTECGGSCISGPKIGQACSVNSQCGSCVGGGTPGANCTSNYGCQAACLPGQQATCETGPNQGTQCTLDDQCTGGPVYPIVTQQWLNSGITVPHPGLSTTIRKSIAFGQLAQTDRNPCDLETGKKPTQYHACTFDGLKWWDLRSNVFQGNSGDFNNDGRAATYQMWIKTSSYVVWLDSLVGPNSDTPQHSEATIPRQYTGPFNRIAMGTGPGSELDVNGNPVTAPACWDYPAVWPASRVMWHTYGYDNVVMMDGVLVSTEGACCLPDTSCAVMAESECLAQDGRFQGTNTTCEETVCCAYPFADVDFDDDVDQDDFGAYQLCYNGSGAAPTGCECFDRNNDGKVDATDFAAFADCFTGANVPWSASITPSCVP